MSMDETTLSPTSSQRPRPRSRGTSFLSSRSRTSEGGTRYSESPSEKAKRDSLWKGASKANPNAAITESQPGEANLYEKTTMQSLHDFQHHDMYGNPIVDADRSNPTRPRMERPLDTIRSFEKAIDEGYNRRHSHMRQDAESWDQNNQYASRRSSYFGGEFPRPKSRHTNTNIRVGNESRPDSMAMGNRYGMQQNGGGYYGNQNGFNGPPRPARYGNNRFQSDPQTYNQRPYQHHGYHQSYDTVNTGYTNGSDSTGPWANSTDPSSENSSIDRTMNKPGTPMDGYGSYGSNGYHGPIMEESAANAYGEYPEQQDFQYNYNGQSRPQDSFAAQQAYYAQQQRDAYEQQQQQQSGYGMQGGAYGRHNSAGAVQPPQPSASGGRRPIPLNSNGSGGANGMRNQGPPPVARQEKQEKRKSWIKRRFSKD